MSALRDHIPLMPLTLGQQQVKNIRIAGVVHDIGKIRVPEGVPPMSDMRPGVLYHHERWDGRGYPEAERASTYPFMVEPWPWRMLLTP